MVYTKNTWRTNDIITADKLNNMENGIVNQNTKQSTFTDFADVASHMDKYAGTWHITEGIPITNGPKSKMDWSIVRVIMGNGSQTGIIITSNYKENIIYYTSVNRGSIQGWNNLAKDSDVVHKTGNETVAGNKSLTGNNSFFGNTLLTDTTVSGSLSVTGSLPHKSFSKTFLGTNFDFNFVKQGQLIFMTCHATSKTTIDSGTFRPLFTSVYPSGWEPAYGTQGGIVVSDSNTIFPIFINIDDVGIRGISIPSGTNQLSINVFYVGKTG